VYSFTSLPSTPYIHCYNSIVLESQFQQMLHTLKALLNIHCCGIIGYLRCSISVQFCRVDSMINACVGWYRCCTRCRPSGTSTYFRCPDSASCFQSSSSPRSTSVLNTLTRQATVVQLIRYLSPLLVLGFTVERYISVCHPFQRHRFCTTRRALMTVAALTTLSLARPLTTDH